ncbi:MAG: HIT domain-containing protein [Thermoproteota archaeon]
MKYVEAAKNESCFLCIGKDESHDHRSLVVWRGRKSFIIMNRYPYNVGHLMVVPFRHVGDLTQLVDEERLDMVKNVDLSIMLLRETLKPDGFNIGVNIGKAAGAGLEGHVHVHVVPRWFGDTNFMPVISQVKVIPELLETTYSKLREAVSKRLKGDTAVV